MSGGELAGLALDHGRAAADDAAHRRGIHEGGLPWFEYYGADRAALGGGERLAGLKSVARPGREKGDTPLPENESVDPARVVELRRGLSRDEVRVGDF